MWACAPASPAPPARRAPPMVFPPPGARGALNCSTAVQPEVERPTRQQQPFVGAASPPTDDNDENAHAQRVLTTRASALARGAAAAPRLPTPARAPSPPALAARCGALGDQALGYPGCTGAPVAAYGGGGFAPRGCAIPPVRQPIGRSSRKRRRPAKHRALFPDQLFFLTPPSRRAITGTALPR
jgi:hypothetical protein